MPRIVRFRDLVPSWETKQAREAGYMRWLVTWLGGPAGHINTNPGTAIENTQCAVGMMYLPVGQRQAGRHIHGVTEIYVVLQGELEGFDASGHPHRAGPMDCTYIPEGCPHGVRNCGMEDVILIWAHDGIERNGTAVYYDDDHLFNHAPPIELVRFADLQPDWSDPGARTPGTMRWSVNDGKCSTSGGGGGPKSERKKRLKNPDIRVNAYQFLQPKVCSLFPFMAATLRPAKRVVEAAFLAGRKAAAGLLPVAGLEHIFSLLSICLLFLCILNLLLRLAN